ncbi:HAD family hydrolase [Microvirga sp. 2MCAF38]|uniref:HAD family hydrolase n=1 Tax=Microvirga sp. 2MCAF38 TaxID=3232989 RepID=UPI003F9553D8
MLKALIFDMDGTLVHSDPLHLRAFVEVLGPKGVVIDDEVYRSRIIGRTNEVIFGGLLPDHSVEEHRDLADEKEAAFRRISSELSPLDGLLGLLAWAQKRDLKIALVTNAPILNAKHMLEVLGLSDAFSVIVTSQDVARGKPDPLPYLTALERLSITADEAIAFEDSPSGMKAAKGAGIYSFGILTGVPAEELKAVGADRTIEDFSARALWDVLEERVAA